MSKEPQVPVGGLIGNHNFGELVDIKDPMKEKNDTMEAHKDVQEDDDVSLENDEFEIYDIVDQFQNALEDNVEFCKFLMSYNCNVLTFRF